MFLWTKHLSDRINSSSADTDDAFTDLHSPVEDAAADLNHLQVLLLLVPCTLDVRHPAPLVLLTGVNEVSDAPVLVKHLWRTEEKQLTPDDL